MYWAKNRNPTLDPHVWWATIALHTRLPSRHLRLFRYNSFVSNALKRTTKPDFICESCLFVSKMNRNFVYGHRVTASIPSYAPDCVFTFGQMQSDVRPPNGHFVNSGVHCNAMHTYIVQWTIDPNPFGIHVELNKLHFDAQTFASLIVIQCQRQAIWCAFAPDDEVKVVVRLWTLNRLIKMNIEHASAVRFHWMIYI